MAILPFHGYPSILWLSIYLSYSYPSILWLYIHSKADHPLYGYTSILWLSIHPIAILPSYGYPFTIYTWLMRGRGRYQDGYNGTVPPEVGALQGGPRENRYIR